MAIKMQLVLSALLCILYGSRQSTTSFSSAGVPCYLHPSADGCHYRLKPDSNNCSTQAQREKLSKKISVVNRTLASLEQQLIRLGVIPPDNACSKLPPVENGGIVYDHLNLAPGTIGRYTCYEGYILVYDENGRYEYVCTEDGIWDGNVITTPVKCKPSNDKCGKVADIENGTVTYINNDSSNTLIGDMVTYSCLPGYEMNSTTERFCLRNGNWSGVEPQCVQILTPHDEGLIISGIRKRWGLILGSSIGPGVVLAIIVTLVIVAGVLIYRKRKSKSKLYQRFESRSNDNTSGDHYESFGDRKPDDRLEETVENAFNDSFERTIEPQDSGMTASLIGKPRSGSKWKPSLQLIKETAVAAAAKGKERLVVAGGRSKRSSRVSVTDDDEDTL